MATPIKLTPAIKNEASVKFNKQLADVKKVSSIEKQRIMSLVDRVLSKSKAK